MELIFTSFLAIPKLETSTTTMCWTRCVGTS